MRLSALAAAVLLLVSAAGHAEEAKEAPKEGEAKEGEAKAKPKPADNSASAISLVMALPVVKQWDMWMSTEGTSTHMTVWGETLKAIKGVAGMGDKKEGGGEKESQEGDSCWEIGVGESTSLNTKLWKNFCVMQVGGEVWVENVPQDPEADVTYMKYEEWVKKCKPSYNSAGDC